MVTPGEAEMGALEWGIEVVRLRQMHETAVHELQRWQERLNDIKDALQEMGAEP